MILLGSTSTVMARRLLPLVLWLLAGCAPPMATRVVLATGFELPAPADSPVVQDIPPARPSTEQVHTGQYAAKMDGNNRNAMLCGARWQALGRPHHLRLRLWGWLPSARLNASLLEVSVQRPATTPNTPPTRLHIQRLGLGEVIRRYRQWTLTTLYITLPPKLLSSDEVAVSLWGLNIGEDYVLYLDDVSLENAD